MRKKLNRKLKFALAGFGAFALAGVSCVGLASLENDDAIASYAIDTPTQDNPVVNGIFTFELRDEYYLSAHFTIDFGDLNLSTVANYIIRFTNSTFSSNNGGTTASLFPSHDSSVVSFSPSVPINNPIWSDIGDYWSLVLTTAGNANVAIIKFSTVDYSSFTVSGTGSPYTGVPVEPPTPVDYVGDIVDILVAGITNLGQGIGQGVSSFVTSLAFNTAGDGLSVYFVLVCVFGGIALAVALTSKIFMWLNGLGA